MAMNFRDEPTKRIARRRFPRNREGYPVLPRIIERPPRHGDIHPLDRQHLARLLRHQPVDYVYGLKRIELLPRQTQEIGRPLGSYVPREKAILLYSLPETGWRFTSLSPSCIAALRAHGAQVVEGDGVQVSWLCLRELAYFMYMVLLHELGHHHDYQYRQKRKWPHGRTFEERSADLHAARLDRRGVFHLWDTLERDA
jgi:hypothetical protein